MSNQIALPTKRRRLSSTSSSSATATNTIIVSADVASLFECPVCFGYILPPILQCQNGHLVCSNCRPKLTRCPKCRGPLGNIRNLAMEQTATTVMFPCKYSTSGCAVSLLHTEKEEHEEACEFQPYSCPCPGASCEWQGSLEEVAAHLIMSHKAITALRGKDIVFLAKDTNLPAVMDWVMVQSCFGHDFMKQAENFAYRLELNGQRRRLTWEATPSSIRERVSSATINSDCLVFETSIAQLLADNDNLSINVTIYMV
ncbi:hypothetical protein Cfor_02729 [Coptotermes formosanus]|uniref:E3 ubiquitin-protein ligase n=1 Tax=Coptotermes formosanus TaxID=36987 RepID=A0A6L2PIU7_COPFO|nr:hypothetical protein Cfor_02729 [Coptotermes formosanus]